MNHRFNTIFEQNVSVFHHFKGHDYNIICIGKNSESENDMVVYQNIKTKEIWIRDAKMFFGNVDKDKYPDILQKERFALK